MSSAAVVTVLTQIPWKLVIEKAPKVLQGAVESYDKLRNRKRFVPKQDVSHEVVERLTDLEERQLQQSELIKDLAEQATYVTSLLGKLRFLTYLTGILGLLVLVLVIVLMLK